MNLSIKSLNSYDKIFLLLITAYLKLVGYSPLNALWAAGIVNLFTGILAIIGIRSLSHKMG